ncbi:MAG: NUDIX domain-containing protein [Oscillospiraceae bacterium]|nr:NUDIX domain-containing protein [Oscillospiraceae bacterium]
MGEFIVAAKAVILYNRKALLVQRSDGGNEWECPGGRVEFGEDLHTALRREIKEETDLEDICIGKLLYAMTGKLGPQRQIVGLMYISYAKSDKVKISHEHIDFIWADKEQFINLLNKHMLNELIENNVLDSLGID